MDVFYTKFEGGTIGKPSIVREQTRKHENINNFDRDIDIVCTLCIAAFYVSPITPFHDHQFVAGNLA